MKNGANVFHGEQGLGFTVNISGLGGRGIRQIGNNGEVNPSGSWVLGQMLSVSYWTFRENIPTTTPLPATYTRVDDIDPRSIIRHNDGSIGWIDHPSPNQQGELSGRMTAHISRWQFSIFAYKEGNKNICKLNFHAEMRMGADGNLQINWGPGL